MAVLATNSSRTFTSRRATQQHVWVTVIDPLNQRSLLQACDDCGVVKSENSVVKRCRAPRGQALISSALAIDQALAG